MRDPSFPKPVAEVIATLVEIFRHQRRAEIVEILESAHARFDNTEYDNWNGGTYTWVLRLEVPVPIFATVEPKLLEIEKEIGSKLAYFSREHSNDPLTEATIAPITPGSPLLGQRMAPSEVEVRRLWPEGRFRLFVSHVAAHKVAVSMLKNALQSYGITGFVAHEAIQPSLEWQREIELALRSMHALLALVTPDFHASNWTDQEVGWALGRGVLVQPVRLGADPYGFAGKVQALTGDLENPKALAQSIFITLLANPQTHTETRRGLVTAFCSAGSYVMAQELRKHIIQTTDFTKAEESDLLNACEKNSNVSRAFGVPEAILNKFGRLAKEEEASAAPDIPF